MTLHFEGKTMPSFTPSHIQYSRGAAALRGHRAAPWVDSSAIARLICQSNKNNYDGCLSISDEFCSNMSMNQALCLIEEGLPLLGRSALWPAYCRDESASMLQHAYTKPSSSNKCLCMINPFKHGRVLAALILLFRHGYQYLKCCVVKFIIF